MFKEGVFMKTHQMSDSILIYILLAVSGGAMDAYSYIAREKVFANAQTGNLLLFGVHLAEGETILAFKYFWPILAFILGIMSADFIRYHCQSSKLHWRQTALFLELLLLVSVNFIPTSLNPVANAFISLACGIQVESFRSLHGQSIATTMCIGNLRSGTFHLDHFLQKHDHRSLYQALLYFSMIFFFVLGAIIESYLIRFIFEKALFLSVLIIFISIILMKLPANHIKA